MGLEALNGRPTVLEVLLVLGIAGSENAILYFLLAAIIGFAFHLVARMRRPHTESPSILGR
jgi:hypothetical protein